MRFATVVTKMLVARAHPDFSDHFACFSGIQSFSSGKDLPEFFLMRSILPTLILFLFASPAMGAIVGTTDADFFNGQLFGTTPTVVNFDGSAVGTVIDNGTAFGGITFTYGAGFGAEKLVITNGTITGSQIDTLSASNFLGTDVNDQLAPEFNDMQMSVGASAFGLFITISEGGLGAFDDDLWLTAGGTEAKLDVDAVHSTLGDGSAVFFLGLIENTGQDLGPVSLIANPAEIVDGYTYRVDNITYATVSVPEPTGLSFLVGTGILLTLRRRRC